MIADLHKQMNLNAKNCNYYIEENKTGFPNHLINLIQDYENEKTWKKNNNNIYISNIAIMFCSYCRKRADQVSNGGRIQA